MAADPVTQSGSAEPRSLGSARERAGYLFPLLLAAFVAAHAAASAISITTAEPAYELGLHLALTVALAVSYLGVRVGRSFAGLGALLMLLVFVAYAFRFDQSLPLISLLYPLEALGDDEVSLSALCAWFLVGFCFMQDKRENLVFVFVPGLAVFGLMATRNLNPELLAVFMVFLSASVYCWGYDHFLRAAETAGRRLDWRHWARAHLSGAALVFILAAVGGLLVGNALYFATPRMYTGFGMQQRIWNFAGAHVQGYFLFRNGFEVGAGPIRLSHEPVLKVQAEEVHLWRGRVYDFYDGTGWERSDESTRRVRRHTDGSFLLRWFDPVRPLEAPQSQPMDLAADQFGMGGPGMPPPAMPPPPGPAQTPMPPGPMQPPMPPPMPRAPEAQTPGSGPPQVPYSPPPGRVPSPGGPPGPSGSVPAPTRSLAAPTWTLGPLKGREFKHTVENIGAATVGLFSASFPERLEFGPAAGPIPIGRGGAITTDSFGSIQTTAIMEKGQTYTVWSRVPDFAPEDLRAVQSPKYGKDFRERYIQQTSADVAAQLGPLVADITRGLDNDYDKALAIQDYLEERCLYTLDVPFTPAGEDRVVYFVRSSRRGACDLFSSAMALMCRLAGIPARVATGFNRGEWSARDQAIVVRGSDAHAWVELYFKGLGWMPFDLVAERSLEESSWASLLRMGQWKLAGTRLLRLLLGVLVVAACVYLATTALVDPRVYIGSALRRWHRRRSLLALLAFEYEGLLRGVALKGRIRHWRPLTPLQLIALISSRSRWQSAPEMLAELERVTRGFYALRYSSRRPDTELVALRREIRQLSRSLRRAGLSR